jgi:hypothetical protein
MTETDFMTRLLVATDPHLQPLITREMVEAGAQAIAPEVWATDPAVFGHPDSLNRRGHELCKSKVRAQASACLEAALRVRIPPLISESDVSASADKIASDQTIIGMDWKLPERDCPNCCGAGRVGAMGCMRCGGTGVDPVQIVARE